MIQLFILYFKRLYNTAFMKIIVASMVTLLLNILWERWLSVVSWIIVFIPFLFGRCNCYYVFGLDAASGTIDYKCKDKTGTTTGTVNNYIEGVTKDAYGNIIIYDPEYNPSLYAVYYHLIL